jgi:hypothetical protein
VIAPVASGRRYIAKDAGMEKRGEQVPARSAMPTFPVLLCAATILMSTKLDEFAIFFSLFMDEFVRRFKHSRRYGKGVAGARGQD